MLHRNTSHSVMRATSLSPKSGASCFTYMITTKFSSYCLKINFILVFMWYVCTIIYVIVKTDWKIGINFLILLFNGKK